MPDTGTPIIVDAVIAESAGVAPGARVSVLSRGRRGSMEVDAAADLVADAPPFAVVLARPPWADPPAAALAGVAMLLDREVVWLPPALSQAAWAVALIATWAAQMQARDLVRRAQVAVGLAVLPECRLPRRPWGCERAQMPALHPISLARWCDRQWSACAHCGVGGGAPGAICGRCGHAVVMA